MARKRDITVFFLITLGNALANLITIQKSRSLARCCTGSGFLSCNKASVDYDGLGLNDLELPTGEVLQFLGYAANNPNVFYFENGEATALITRKVNGNGLHGHAQTGNGSYVLEYCGDTDGHVWKVLEPMVEHADTVKLPNPELDGIALDLPSVSDDTFVSVSIKFYYTAEFANTTSDIDGFLDQIIAETNQGFENSGINMQVYKLCHEQSTVVESGNYLNTLADFKKSKPAAELRDGADVAALLVDNLEACGVAYFDTIKSGYTFSVTKKSCASAYYTFGHELGHSVGCDHDPNKADNIKYNYGHGHLIEAGKRNKGVRSIMAYYDSSHETRVNWWSNPNINYPPTGTPTGSTKESNNAKVWQDNRAALAAVGKEDSAVCGVGVSPPELITISCAVENMKPILKRSKRKISKEDCQNLCARNKACIYWWWKKRGKKCYIWNMLYKSGKNMGTGVKNCGTKCNAKSFSSCNTGNKKPAMQKVLVKDTYYSMGDCKKLCDAQTNCVLWWWNKRGNKCTTWNLSFGKARNMASGSRSCCHAKPDQGLADDFHPPKRTLGGNSFPFLNLPSNISS